MALAIRSRLSEQVYDLVRQDLEAGALPRETPFFEAFLAAKYGVSRTPVREALARLVSYGLLVTYGRGFILPACSDGGEHERLEVETLLAPKIAYYAAQSSENQKIAALEATVQRAAASREFGHIDAYRKETAAFRLTLYAMCPNALLKRCAELIEVHAAFAPQGLMDAEQWSADLAQHMNLLERISACDPSGAEVAMRALLQARSAAGRPPAALLPAALGCRTEPAPAERSCTMDIRSKQG